MESRGPSVLEPAARACFTPQGPPSTSGSATCPLPARFEAVKRARDFTCETLCLWQLTDRLDGIALVVSELVTNALRHGLPACPSPSPNPPVRLHLMRRPAHLVCAVRDPSTAPPVAPETGGGPEALLLSAPGEEDAEGPDGLLEAWDFAESGRGLRLVESFSNGWGWHPVTSEPKGKIVWARFDIGES